MRLPKVDTSIIIFCCVAIAFVIFVGTIVYFASSSDNKWAQNCHDKGGHTVNVSKGEICLDSNDVYLGKNG